MAKALTSRGGLKIQRHYKVNPKDSERENRQQDAMVEFCQPTSKLTAFLNSGELAERSNLARLVAGTGCQATKPP